MVWNMISMVAMDVRRMLRSKSFYLAILIFLVFSGYCIYAQATWQVINGYPVPENLQLEAGLYSIVDYYLNSTLQYMYTFTFKNGLIVFGIFITSFVASDYQSGFIKNKCMMCKSKSTIIWAKLFVSILLGVIVLLLSFLLTTVLGYLFISDFHMGYLNEILIFAGSALLLYVAYFTGLTFLYRFLRSKLPSILLSVFFPLGLTMVLLEPLLGDYVTYSLSGVFLKFPMVFQSDVSIPATIVCVVYIILYHCLSLWLFHKRDI